MKKISLTLIALALLTACNFSKGVKKDLTTGLSASYNGFALEDVYLAAEDGSRLPNNQVPLGSKIRIVVDGVENFANKDGKVFPGCTIVLTDKQGKSLLNLPDAFESLNAGTTEDQAHVLQADLSTGNPMVSGETYHLKTRFFDKNNPESEIVAEVDLVMQ
jgi:predicted small secreted protein